MNHTSLNWLDRSGRLLPKALGAVVLTASACLPVAAQISQVPLLTQKGSVEPNLVLSLDTSGSMKAQFMFIYGGVEHGYGRAGPRNVSQSEIITPADSTPPSLSDGVGMTVLPVGGTSCPGTLSLTVTCAYNEPASTRYELLSPDVNSLTYDPRIRYRLRVDSSGTTDTPGSTAAADAAVPPQTADFHVYFYRNASNNNVTWPGTGPDPLLTGSYFTSYTPAPGLLISGATTGRPYPRTVGSGTDGLGPFPRFINRTDCNGGAATGGTCSLPEERKNYAIWKKYHSNRLDLVKTGLGLAFDQIGPTMRLGWGTIFDMNGGNLHTGVSLFNSSQKVAFYSWLYSRNVTWGGTPNLGAVDTMGKYFSRTDNKGPWATTPDPTSTGSAILSTSTGDQRTDRKTHLTCRRSYGMLITDGYYDGTTSVGNVDSTAQPTITGSSSTGAALTYTYNGTTRPYPGGGSNTLADIAMKYWVTDLRPGLTSDNTNDGIDNRVKTVADTVVGGVISKRGNESFWQNMSLYGVGLGVVGTLAQTEGAAGTVLENIRNNVANINNAGASVTGWPTAAQFTEESIDDLWHGTINGRGRMLSAKNSDTLADGVEGMLADINKDTSSQSGVAASTVSLVSSTKKYTPSYTTGAWTGNITSTELDNSGAETCINWRVVGSATSTGTPGASPYIPPTCSASNVTYNNILAHGSRNIYAWNGSGYGNFNSANSYVTANVVGGTNSNLINFLRGDQTNEDTATVTRTYRQREFLLGDIVNSTPSFIQGALDMKYDRLPSGTYGQAQYAAFLTTKAARPEGVLFAGANDGMLHGFRDSNGAEAFAFVPKGVMPNMHLLASRSYNHQYYVDGPTVEVDACLTGGSACTSWSNLLLGTLGAGGKGVYAIDVTTLTPGATMGLGASNIKWEITAADTGFANLGNILTEVQTGLTMSGHWVAVFGNGYYGADGKAYLYVVDLSTGALVAGSSPIAAGSATSNGLGGVRLVYNDNDTDRRIIGAYAGDLKGNMWKFDLKDSNPASWRLGINGAALFTSTASPTQPITAAPTVVKHPNNDGSVVVAFGTGKLFDSAPNDFGNTDVQSLYGVWDTVPFGSATTGSNLSGTSTLVLQTISAAVSGSNVIASAAGVTSTTTVNYYSVSTNPIVWTTKRGWYINLTNLGQRVIYSLETLIGRYAAVDTVSPSNLSTDPCATTGTAKAWNYVIDMVTGGGVTGGGVPEAIYDTNGDGVVNASDATVTGYENSADGRTRYLKNAIVSTSNADWGYGSSGSGSNGGYLVFVGLSTQQLPQTKINVASSCIVNCATTGITKVVKRSWRQLFPR